MKLKVVVCLFIETIYQPPFFLTEFKAAYNIDKIHKYIQFVKKFKSPFRIANN